VREIRFTVQWDSLGGWVAGTLWVAGSTFFEEIV
jgi:hypothetical protein